MGAKRLGELHEIHGLFDTKVNAMLFSFTGVKQGLSFSLSALRRRRKSL